MAVRSQFQTLFAYHFHTTSRLLDCAARLSENAYRAHPGYGHGALHDLFFHLLRADRGWRTALETGRQSAGIQSEEFPDLAALRAGLAAEQAAWQALVDGLTDEQSAGDVELINWRGDRLTMPRWRILQHLVLHGMQHHAELAERLTAAGQPPGDIDFIFYR
jgi:uncharacterized damage-inducible protein DinB